MEATIAAERLGKLQIAIKQAGLDAVAINPGPTFSHLTGVSFHLMERPVVMIVAGQGEPVLVLPEFEFTKAGRIPYKVSSFTYGENPTEWEAVFRRAVTSVKLDGRKIGVEPRQMRLLEFWHVRAGAPEAEFPDATEALASLRLRKDEGEIAAMRKAVQVAQSALEALLLTIRVGVTERELASALTMELLRHGSDSELPFAPIVCSGPNSANPHATPSDRKIARGELLLVDWGATVDGYISDLTRTFAVGEVDAEWTKIASIVQEANMAGRAAGKPGVPCASVDKAARAVIEQAGYGKYFTHRTGHGIGMEGHEEPYMRGDNMHMLYPGMTYTVEPGIYLDGRGGVRIEDDVVVTKTGVDVLSDLPRELRVVG
jgi:Xaa-Pro dipeptidase